jgi:hypothetical protein
VASGAKFQIPNPKSQTNSKSKIKNQKSKIKNQKSKIKNQKSKIENRKSLLAACTEAQRRATQTLEWANSVPNASLLDVALNHLTLARAHLYHAVLEADFPADSALQPAATELDHALRGLRQANMLDDLPKALLTAALLDAVRGEAFLPSALAHLAEAQQIAERGPMPLYLADVHLHRARILMLCEPTALAAGVSGDDSDPARPAASAVGSQDTRTFIVGELAKARQLIEKHHYGRRAEELADAEHLVG